MNLRILNILALIIINKFGIGQTVEYRNDSLFFNNTFITAKTSTSALDALLKSKGRTEASEEEDYVTGKPIAITTVYYDELGIFIRKDKKSKKTYSVGIKMKVPINKEEEDEHYKLAVFKGKVIINSNIIPAITKSKDLEQLKNCTVMYRGVRTSSGEFYSQAEITDGKSEVIFFYDTYCGEVKTIEINVLSL